MSTINDSIRRPVNVAYLVVGLVFLGIAGAWALVAGGAIESNQLGWLLPLTLVGAGVIGLVALAARTFGGGGGATRLDGPLDGDHDTDVDDLEMRAYAPYLSDTERTRILDEESAGDRPQTRAENHPETETHTQRENGHDR